MICKIIEDCKEKLTVSKHTFEDKKGNKSKLLIENRSNSTFYKIDFENCVYQKRQSDTKCDFGLETTDSIYFVELKGSKVLKGIEQLLKTMSETENCFGSKSLKARLIVSKFPKPHFVRNNTYYKNLVKKVGFKGFIIKEKVCTEII